MATFKKVTLFFTIFIILILAALLKNSYEFKKPSVQSIGDFFTNTKTLSMRDKYLEQGIKGFIEKPLLGFGLGNFRDISKTYSYKREDITESSHNIFLDVLSESGVIAFILFAVIIFTLLKNSEKNVFFFMWFCIFLNFQTYYSHRIFCFFFIFCILAGLSFKEMGRTNTDSKANK